MKRRRGKPAKARSPFMTREDAKRWRKLVKEARWAIKAPTLAGGDFLIAASKARGAVFPPQVIRGELSGQPFLDLIKAGMNWPTTAPEARTEAQGRLRDGADAVERILNDALPRVGTIKRDPDAPPRPFRADIDG